MSLTLTASPDKDIDESGNYKSNVNAGNSQLPYSFLEDDLSGKVNYKVNVEIWDTAITAPVIPITFKYSVRPDGSLFVDAGRILMEIQRTGNIKNVSFRFVLRFFETYEGFEGVLQNAPQVQSIIASRQLLSSFGSNLYKNLLHIEGITINPFDSWISLVRGVLNSGDDWTLTTAWRSVRSNPGNSQYLRFAEAGVSGTFIAVRVTFTYVKNNGNQLNFRLYGEVGGSVVQLANISLVPGTTEGTVTTDFIVTTSQDFESFGLGCEADSSTGFEVDILSAETKEFNEEIHQILTTFKNPLMWRGWKRTMSCLIDSRFNARTGIVDPVWLFEEVDINKVGNGEPRSDLIISGTVVTVVEDIVLEPVRANGRFMSLFVSDIPRQFTLSNKLFYELREECKAPIMIEWLSSSGSYEQHLFTLETIFNNSVTEGLTGQASIEEDIEFVNRTEGRIPLWTTQEAILTEENLLIDQVLALNEIKVSEEVRVWLNKDGSKFVGVVVNNLFSTEINNDNTSFDISIQIKFPNNFKFSDGKLY